MVGLGTIINTTFIIIGGIIGLLLSNLFSSSMQDSLKKACGISVIFISIAGAMEQMLTINQNNLISKNSMMIVICMLLGTFIGEIIDIDNKFEIFAKWLKNKTGNNKDDDFVNAFLTASFTVCIGAMAVVGAIEDGLTGDWTTLFIKSILDLIIVAVLSSSMGKGAIFSAIPVLIVEGFITIFAKIIQPIITENCLNYLSLIGSLLICAVGINLIFKNIIKISNMLPSLIIAIIVSNVI